MVEKPHIFISYRRADDLTMTGRIYDRLCSMFGEDCVFKDMEDIPAGADFRQVLDKAIASADVVLVIIGQKWLNATNAAGQRRLDEPNDFVRTEIESALKHSDVMVIPTLIDGATMPAAEQLPTSIQDLAYRNAVMVRVDPDFSRDIEALEDNIRKQFKRPGTTKTDSTRLRRIRLFGGIAAALIVLLVIVAGFVLSRSGMAAPTLALSAPVLPFANATATPEPIPPGKVLVLVAALEPVRNPTARDVARFIVQDLNTVIDRSNAYSETVTRQYNTVVKTDQEAQAAAEQTGAAVIVWGSYTDQDVTLNLQVGSLKSFSPLQLSRDTLEQTVNVRLQLTDERTQSIAAPVLAILVGIQGAASDSFQLSRTVALLSYLKPSDKLLFLDDTVAANCHRAFPFLLTDPKKGADYLVQAIKNAASNPLLHALKTLFDLQQGNIDNARISVRTAATISTNWYLLPYLQATIDLSTDNYTGVISAMNDAVKREPNNWYPLYLRGTAYLLSGQFELAAADLDKAIALEPQSNIPYLVTILLKLRAGQFDAVGGLYGKSRRDFPDPTFGARLIDVFTAKATPSEFRGEFNLMSSLFLGRYRELINLSDEITKAKTFKSDLALSSLYLMRGFAFCNLDNDKDAEDAYTQSLARDAENVSLYMLRADVRKRLGNVVGVAADVAAASSKSKEPNFSAYYQANVNGQLTCKNVFDFMIARAQNATPAATQAK